MGDLLLDENIEYIEEDNIGSYLPVSDDDYNSDPEEVSNIVSSNSINRSDFELLDKSAIKKGGVDLENKSDVLISSGDAVNNLNSVKSINIDSDLSNFESTLLYNNDSPTVNQSTGDITLLQDYSYFDYLCFNFRRNKTQNITISIIVNTNDFINNSSLIKPCSFNVNINGSMSYRYLVENDDDYSTIHHVTSTGAENIIVSIYGLNEKEVVIPDPTSVPEQPTISGNTIINNYYGCVSDNSLSYNIMNKPLNQYNTAESFCAFGCLFALGIVLYLLIRKVIFKWQ